MKLTDMPFVLRHSLKNRGLIRTVAILPERVFGRFARRSARKETAVLVHPFDVEFGTDTGGMVYAEELRDSLGRRSIYNTAYYGTAPSLFQQALVHLKVDFEGYTFIDLGAGKGRMILLASNFPFQQIIGVEFAQELQGIACENISRYHPASRRCQDVRCILSDACDFSFPPGALVIFMWNSFVGPVFERVLSNLEDSLRREPREVYLLYLKPDCAARLDASPWLEKIWECSFEMTEKDFSCYQVGGRAETCSAYRSRCHLQSESLLQQQEGFTQRIHTVDKKRC